MVNLKLEELRKRLLEPMPTVGTEPGNKVYRRKLNDEYSNPPALARQASLRADSEELEPEAFGQELPESGETTLPMPPEEPPRSVSTAVLQYVQQAGKRAPEEEAVESNSEDQLAQAVAKVFEQTGNFQDRFGELAELFAPIERASQAAVRSFEPLRRLQKQIFQLARSFEPTRSFQNQLAALAENFEPMRGLQQQLLQLSEAFQNHLGRLSKSLEPAREFQIELLKVASAFESATELQNQFQELAETFKTRVERASDASEADTRD
jgi:hypothetical protein